MSISSEDRTPTIILNVEDDDAAFRLLTIAFQELDLPVTLYRAVDGEDALHFLHQQGAYVDSPRPALILLNINLPKLSGIETLAAIKANSSLVSIPIVMFTSSSLDQERAKCLALGAKEYLTKTSNYPDLIQSMNKVLSMVTPAVSDSRAVATDAIAGANG